MSSKIKIVGSLEFYRGLLCIKKHKVFKEDETVTDEKELIQVNRPSFKRPIDVPYKQ